MIIRTYACDDCKTEFEVTCNSDDPDPECPRCCVVLEWRPKSFAITGTKSKAVDFTQKVLEEDYGLTNFRDGQRAGDVAALTAAAPTTSEREREMRQLSEAAQQTAGVPMTDQQAAMAQQFWGGGTAMQKALPADTLLAGARTSTAAANAEGVNPMALLHAAGKKGQLRTKINVVARAKM